MGAWGYKIFENDDAADFIVEFENEGSIAVVRALDAACAGEDYLEAPEASIALAAAAFVAGANGKADILSDDATAALRSVSDWQALAGFKGKATKALQCIDRPNSELLELWAEASDADLAGFRNELDRLRAALR